MQELLKPEFSRSDPRRFNQHAFGAYRQVQFQFHQFLRAVGKWFGAHAAHAVAQAALQRAKRLPFQPVHRVAGGVRLGDLAAA